MHRNGNTLRKHVTEAGLKDTAISPVVLKVGMPQGNPKCHLGTLSFARANKKHTQLRGRMASHLVLCALIHERAFIDEAIQVSLMNRGGVGCRSKSQFIIFNQYLLTEQMRIKPN
jgi:hypothetical protein